MTPCTSETVSRLAMTLALFRETKDTLELLGRGTVSTRSGTRRRTCAATQTRSRRPRRTGDACRGRSWRWPTRSNTPCTKADTKGDIGELMGMLKVQGVARGSGTAPRMQCVANREVSLEQSFRDVFPFAVFTNDFMHASGYMSTCCQTLGIANAQREYRTCRATVLRHGVGSAVDRIKRPYAKERGMIPHTRH